MVQNDLDIEKVECTEVDCRQTRSKVSGIRREPSFSRWCNEDGVIHLDHPSENSSSCKEDSDFQLPLLQQGESEKRFLDRQDEHFLKFQQQCMQLNGGNTMNGASVHVEGNGKGKYVPFDIENGSGRELNSTVSDVGGFNAIGNPEELPPNSRSSLSVPDMLKTLFFILLWYIFSTFLTL